MITGPMIRKPIIPNELSMANPLPFAITQYSCRAAVKNGRWEWNSISHQHKAQNAYYGYGKTIASKSPEKTPLPHPINSTFLVPTKGHNAIAHQPSQPYKMNKLPDPANEIGIGLHRILSYKPLSIYHGCPQCEITKTLKTTIQNISFFDTPRGFTSYTFPLIQAQNRGLMDRKWNF